MTENPHPLDPATADEYLTGRKIMADAGLLSDPVRFAYYGLEEPPKQDVLGGAPADQEDPRADLVWGTVPRLVEDAALRHGSAEALVDGEVRLTYRQLAEAVDPVCGMTVMAGTSSLPFEHDRRTYYFCCAGCRRSFEEDPDAYIKAVLK